MTHKYAEQLNKNSGLSSHLPTPVAVVGVRGYSGLELLRILLKHPGVQVHSCFATDAGFSLSDYLPEQSAKDVPVLPMSQFAETASRVKVVFLATPAEVSAELAETALEQGADVIDLSGAFRLDVLEAKKWYGLEFRAGALATPESATYGLSPWVGPLSSPVGGRSARLIANPGCFATSALMAILPLLRQGLIDPSSLVIDAKSGATGAGRKAAENLLFCEVDNDCQHYRVGKHQHLPEIKRFANLFGASASATASTEVDPMFGTSLLATRRGIVSAIYARIVPGTTLQAVDAAFESAYGNYPLVRFGRIEGQPRQVLSLKRVVGSARTEIRYELQGNKLYVISLIDNLLKGAASQAVENLNRLLDCPLNTALSELEGVL